MEIDLGSELGATKESLTQRLTLYVPDKDKEGNSLADHFRWVTEARQLLTQVGNGATALPAAEGTWLRADSQTIWEKTIIVYSYILPAAFRANVARLRRFLRQFGRETNQGEVVVEFDGEFFRIDAFDP